MGAVGAVHVPEGPSLVVTTEADVVDSFDGEISLREAIGYAAFVGAPGDGDVITFADGIERILLGDPDGDGALSAGETASELAVAGGDTIAIRAGDTPVTLDGGGATRILSSTASDLAIEGLVLENGAAGADGSGGAIRAVGGLTLEAVTITGSTAVRGGGLYVDGTLTITGSTIAGNTATTAGGGIGLAAGATATLADTMVSGNALEGAGISLVSGGGVEAGSDATLVLVRATIAGNTLRTDGSANGGGLAAGPRANVTMEDSLISGNAVVLFGETASASGGGIRLGVTSALVARVIVVSSNTVSGGSSAVGGGINAFAGRVLDISGSTIADNLLAADVARGGGIAGGG